ncbi:MAG TPA: alpha/beta fold hydrolase [Ktedonobacterales bacterium]|nr:alpha/beta fold hydrolase [Ktedonobacterales bacterium]
MYYEIQGEGEPLALSIGLGTDISEWQRIIQPLAQHHTVIAFDNRGAGRTDTPEQAYTIERMADDTDGLLRALGIERADIRGVSLGGRIALALALAHPERVDKLVLVSTSARAAWRPWWFGLAGMLSSALRPHGAARRNMGANAHSAGQARQDHAMCACRGAACRDCWLNAGAVRWRPYLLPLP